MSQTFAEIPPLRVHPKLKKALDAYCKQIGVPRAKVLRQIIREYLGPMAQDLGEPDPSEVTLTSEDEAA